MIVFILQILNCTKVECPIFYVGLFPQLERLAITPGQLTEDTLSLLVNRTNLRELIIVQDPYSGRGRRAVSPSTWRQTIAAAPHLNVRIEIRGPTDEEILVQVGCIIEDPPPPEIRGLYIGYIIINGLYMCNKITAGLYMQQLYSRTIYIQRQLQQDYIRTSTATDYTCNNHNGTIQATVTTGL